MGSIVQMNCVPRFDLAVLENPIVPSGTPISNHGLGQPIVEGERQLEARLAWLADLQDGTANAVDVSDAEIAFENAFDRQVFAESARDEFLLMLGVFLRPCCVMRRAISIYRLFRAAMDPQIRLLIAAEAQPSDFHRAFDVMLAKGARHALRAERSSPSNLDREEARGDDPHPLKVYAAWCPWSESN